MSLLFIVVGGVFALLFVLLLLVQAVRRQASVGFVQLLLGFLALFIPMAGLILNQWGDQPVTQINQLALAIAVVMIVVSIIGFLLELRRPERFKSSRGILGIGVGLLLAAATSIVPGMAENSLSSLPASPTPFVVARAEETESADEPSATPTRTPSPTLTLTPTQTRTPAPTPTATATRFQFSTRTPAPTATLPNPCLALADYNLNLRAEADMDSEVVATIPFNTTITLFGRNEDSTWWYGEYEGQDGWLNGEFLTLSASCDDLPERE